MADRLGVCLGYFAYPKELSVAPSDYIAQVYFNAETSTVSVIRRLNGFQKLKPQTQHELPLWIKNDTALTVEEWKSTYINEPPAGVLFIPHLAGLRWGA